MAASAPVQTGRLLSLKTPLGNDVVIPTAFRGREAFSALFEFTVTMVSTKDDIKAEQLLGKSVTLSVARPDSSPRVFNGIVASFAAADKVVAGFRKYQIIIRPQVWLLTRTSDCRIFQNQSVIQITETLFSDGGISNYKKQGLNGSHKPREFCVQYRETDFDFLCRIWAEEGIYFYFQHSDGQHTLILSDSVSGYCDCIDKSVQHAQPMQSDTICVLRWDDGNNFVSGKYTLDDYNFEQPTTSLVASTTTVLTNSQFKKWELFDYPGDYKEKSDGQTLSRTRMEQVESTYEIAEGETTYRGFMAGAKITMAKHEVKSEQGKSHVLASVEHDAADETHLGNTSAEAVSYKNKFTALPATTVFRPPPVMRRPLIPGPQTAMVVGPSGDEIYCDKYGRIRVQFHWDRLGTNDEKSSCWIRVAQIWSGATWGALFTPRVGMEVVVAFLDGDPDRPLVVGCVYNGQNMPPYTLPDNKTQSGIKTRSSPKGTSSTYNEFRLEDKKGSELFYMRAQKDFQREVMNDDTLTVQNDQTITITNNRTETVSKGNESVTISQGNRTLAVSKGNMTTTVAEGNRAVTVSKGNDTTTVSTGNRSVTVSKGNDTTTVSQGNMTIDVSKGNYSLTLGSGNATVNCSGGSMTLEAASSITIKVGSNSLVINQSGVTLKGTQVTTQATGTMEVKGSMVQISGSGTTTVKGGMVSIN